ncbi:MULTISPECIES: hypothetical protein [Asticcacaulis]|uniref:hypothetical protein n=1 Tax=Asticcacaulis TaxID=76890 RepID=UPI001AE5505C|nr:MULTISPECIES: hypothetical protein [Asticcacaulis]MBP2157615.1 hypothetical protein [Asticcacaulis solisilvae]MDR6798660.1 hypothetical protein [Asticcacaulis sp. BE141]
MKKTLIALAALTAAATGVAVPSIAAADTRGAVVVHVSNDRWDHNRRDDRAEYRLDSRIDNLYDRIRMGRRSGDLSRREADRLLSRLDSIASERRRAERTGRGLTPREVASLSDRLDRLSREVRYERNDRDNRRW